jgi:hypothetical protein
MLRSPLPSIYALVITAAVGIAATSCISREVAEVQPLPNKEQFKVIPVDINRDIDILFVIDNSGSMGEEQVSLNNNFVNFINVLQNIEGGLPNVHIGVVSTDVGAGPYGLQRCIEPGDNGLLQAIARDSNCSPPSPEKYIVDLANTTGGRDVNWTGSLEDTFRCIAKLGVEGCGFEQPLESMRRALDGRNPGFIRDSAFLAIIFIADEDDCSTRDGGMFDPAQTAVNSELGPLDSFRCFEFGVECNPDNPRDPGSKLECVSREDSAYMYPVKEYIDFVKGLKDDPLKVIVAGIIGETEPVTVTYVANSDGIEEPKLASSCSSSFGEADPGVRLARFMSAFPQRNTVQTICPTDGDLSGALVLIGELLKKVIGSPCLEGTITLPPQCEVSEVRFANTDLQEETPIPPCQNPDGDGNTVCWVIESDPVNCPEGQQLAITIYPEDRVTLSETHTYVRCVGE